MRFQRIEPRSELKAFVECFWIVEGDDPTPILQKVIPDGFPEIIFHYGDPYRTRLKERWELQSDKLVAGQISNYFYLENTGRSSILGVKLRPTALTHLFNVSMHALTDKVLELNSVLPEKFTEIDQSLQATENNMERVDILQGQLMQLIPTDFEAGPVDRAVNAIFTSNGGIPVSEICQIAGTSERNLERAFKKHVGLSPKFYTRIIRFNYIFQLAKEKKLSWIELGLESGFYDQSHFIKNFKAFTGQDPSEYFFDEANLANFFLKK